MSLLQFFGDRINFYLLMSDAIILSWVTSHSCNVKALYFLAISQLLSVRWGPSFWYFWYAWFQSLRNIIKINSFTRFNSSWRQILIMEDISNCLIVIRGWHRNTLFRNECFCWKLMVIFLLNYIFYCSFFFTFHFWIFKIFFIYIFTSVLSRYFEKQLLLVKHLFLLAFKLIKVSLKVYLLLFFRNIVIWCKTIYGIQNDVFLAAHQYVIVLICWWWGLFLKICFYSFRLK